MDQQGNQQEQPLSSQAQITNVYNHIFASLQQGQQPGSNKDISAATRLSQRKPPDCNPLPLFHWPPAALEVSA